MKKYIGVDLGGTMVRTALVTEDGEILQILDSPSHAQEGPRRVIDNLLGMLAQLPLDEVEGIGIGVPGPVDPVKRVMTLSSNIKDMAFYPIADELEETLGKPVVINNDANAAGLAEAVLGAGKGYPVVFYITQSTGIGGALIIDGHAVSGRRGYGGEIANLIIKDNAESINGLNPGAVESEASGTAIGRKGAERLGEAGNTAKKVFALAKENNPVALKLIDEMAYDMARLMSAITCVAAPDCFVIGGGVSHAADQYFDQMKAYLNTLVHENNRDIPVFRAECPEPGVIGAAMLARMEL